MSFLFEVFYSLSVVDFELFVWWEFNVVNVEFLFISYVCLIWLGVLSVSICVFFMLSIWVFFKDDIFSNLLLLGNSLSCL